MINRLFFVQASCLFSLTAAVEIPNLAAIENAVQPGKELVDARWNTFKTNREFHPFQAGRSDEELKKEFEDLRLTRREVWKTPGYEIAQYLIDEDHVRVHNCVAFNYNNADRNYNASLIHLGGKVYLAAEGPRSKDIPNFFKLMNDQCVTHLIRLTDSHEGETKKCHPYWENRLRNTTDGDWLDIPANENETRSIHAYDMAYWIDNQGIDPSLLLDRVLEVRDAIREPESLLLVHCSAGVGRTGTFLASLAIVDAIDRNESFSIEEITYYLSLQRVNSVAQPSQYVTLHRLAEIYMQKQKNQ